MNDQSIEFEELLASGGKVIGLARLNQPKALNSISLAMIRALHEKLNQWENRPDIAAVWLEGAGEKAFCAGGDIVALYRSMTEHSDHRQSDEGVAFFTEEYELDYQIHTYTKPIIVWGNGIVMGGGVGLLAGASYRVVTENSRVAMPEVTIGLYPDVGASWFLNRMPGRSGLFLGLSGAHMNAADACFAGFADRVIAHDHKAQVLDSLQRSEMLADRAHLAVSDVLREFEQESARVRPESELRRLLDDINRLTDANTLSEIAARIAAYDGDEPLFQKAAKVVSAGSPTSMAIFERQLQETRHDSLAQVFEKELKLSIRCLEKGEFAEGVRALLIDKDKQPRWRYSSLEGMDQNWIDGFFDHA